MANSRRINIKRVSLAALSLLLVTGLQAQRQPLRPRHQKVEAKGPNFEVSTDPASGNYVIKYSDGKRWRTVTYLPGNRLSAVVDCSVEAGKDESFVYQYRVFNREVSEQQLFSFTVEYSGVILDPVAPEGWVVRPFSNISALDWSRLRRGGSALEPGKVQAGFAFRAGSLPSSQLLARHPEGTAVAHSTGTLPGIVACHAEGLNEAVSFPTEPPEGASEAIPRGVDAGISGRTVGPVLIPREGGPAALVAQLRSYLKISQEEGWFSDPGVPKKYEVALQQFEQALKQKELSVARSILQVLGNQAKVDLAAKRITSEVYALIKYNADFLGGWIGRQ